MTSVEVIFIDRWYKYHGPLAKMFVKDIRFFDPFLWYRCLWRGPSRLAHGGQLPTSPITDPKTTAVSFPTAKTSSITVVYIDRQAVRFGSEEQRLRRMDQSSHEAIIALLRSLSTAYSDIKYHVVKMEDHDFEQQILIANSADVLIGVHGNGLTHALLMPPHRYHRI